MNSEGSRLRMTQRDMDVHGIWICTGCGCARDMDEATAYGCARDMDDATGYGCARDMDEAT